METTELAGQDWTKGDEAALARGRADHAAGRTISNAAVMAWVRSWGAEDELASPKMGD